MPNKMIFFLICTFLLWGCGGDEQPSAEDDAELDSAETASTNEVRFGFWHAPNPEALEDFEEDFEPVEIPDPNGVFLPIYEDNGEKMERS